MNYITPDELKKNFPNASPSTISRNCDVPGRLPNSERQCPVEKALDRAARRPKAGKSRVGIFVTITSFRRRLLDGDNLQIGSKCLRDCIATSLSVDDGQPNLIWEYHQVKTAGPEGTVVQITAG